MYSKRLAKCSEWINNGTNICFVSDYEMLRLFLTADRILLAPSETGGSFRAMRAETSTLRCDRKLELCDLVLF